MTLLSWWLAVAVWVAATATAQQASLREPRTALFALFDGLGCCNAAACQRFKPNECASNYRVGVMCGEVLAANNAPLRVVRWIDLGGDDDDKSAVPPVVRMSGSLDAVDVAAMQHLTHLRITHTTLSSTIPSQLGLLSSLTWLDLSFNELRGTIPSQLAAIPGLKQLWLQRNRLEGTIPPEIMQMASMDSLKLHHNVLRGNVSLANATFAINTSKCSLQEDNDDDPDANCFHWCTGMSNPDDAELHDDPCCQNKTFCTDIPPVPPIEHTPIGNCDADQGDAMDQSPPEDPNADARSDERVSADSAASGREQDAPGRQPGAMDPVGGDGQNSAIVPIVGAAAGVVVLIAAVVAVVLLRRGSSGAGSSGTDTTLTSDSQSVASAYGPFPDQVMAPPASRATACYDAVSPCSAFHSTSQLTLKQPPAAVRANEHYGGISPLSEQSPSGHYMDVAAVEAPTQASDHYGGISPLSGHEPHFVDVDAVAESP